jgi:hypothetical protein
VNAGVLATGTSRVNIVGGTVTTNALGASGLFATDPGTVIALSSGATVSTTGRASAGAAATFGGVDSLTDAAVTTTGAAATGVAAGDGGIVALTRATVTTAAADAPALRASGVLSAAQSTLTATAGPGLVVDAGSVTLDESRLTAGAVGVALGAGADTSAVVVSGGAIVSGDALLRAAGARGTIVLRNNVTVASAAAVLLRADSSAIIALSADGELLTGDVLVDATSAATLSLAHGTLLRGAVQHAAVALDSTSSWSVTGGSAVTSLSGVVIVNDAITNVLGNGFAVTYDPALPENAELAGKTYALANGGTLVPR